MEPDIACSLRRDGMTSRGRTFFMCFHPQAVQYKTEVTLECCAVCPVRTREVTVYKPLWPGCDRRNKESRTEPCGCRYEVAICQHPDSAHHAQEVRPKECGACPLKEIVVQ